MSIKTKIKNDLWQVNYIIPFVKKELAKKNKAVAIKKILEAYNHIHPIKAKGNDIAYDIKKLLETVDIDISKNSRFIYFIDTSKTIAVKGSIISNFSLDYNKVVNIGFSDISRKALGDDLYGKRAKQVIQGFTCLRDRIVDAIENSNLTTELKDKHITEFKNMFDKPAQHFDEALQRILFFNQILWQTRHRLNGLGRLDKILARVYRQDIDNKYCTKDDIKDMIDDFLFQLSRYSSYKSDALEGDIGQIIILGGLEPDNEYFCNELTYFFLEAQAKSKRPDPKTFLRVSEKMPEELLIKAVECLNSKTGSPLFSNDDVVIDSLLDFGIERDDAYNYCTSACWEPFIAGKSFDQNNIAVFNFLESFDKMLNKEKLDNLGFDEIIDIFIKYNNDSFSDFLDDTDKLKWAEDPIVSIFTESCNDNRTDVSQGGARYNNYGITTVGLANVVDSLFFIKKYVLQEKKYSISQINEARNKNFDGFDALYKEIQNICHSYGHDEKDVVFVVNKITKGMSDVAANFKNKLGGSVKFGLSSPAYIMASKKSAADFSGRKKGMPFNTHISCTDAAYTEIVNFGSKLDYTNQRFNGNVIDYFVSPNLIKDNINKFVLFMKGSIVSGFFQMQMNVLDSRTLINAKKEPEKYAGLIVRVWGFSAYFNDLPKNYQDLLIERAIKAENIIHKNDL